MNKKKILFIGEASSLNTGFSTYYRELLPRLIKTNKYEIAELSSYIGQSDPRQHEFVNNRWKFYGTMPESEAEYREFQKPDPHPRAKGQNTAQFGSQKFPLAITDFKPDIVVSIRDNWMDEFVNRSPFRSYFKFIWMPTIDSAPQHEDWIKDYEQCNLVLSYSDFGINALKRTSPTIKMYGKPMRPGVDLNTFKKLNKIEIRQEWLGLKDDEIRVVGCTMRNQARKLFPDLIDGFALMKNKYGGLNKEIKDKTREERIITKAVLLLHTSWPDNAFSYDYPRHIARLQSNYFGCDSRTYYKGIKNDILNTFICYECNHIFASWAINLYGQSLETKYGRAKIWISCQKCGKLSAATPDTSKGYSREQLAEVYNLMDLYCQVSIAEGDGMPIQESKACHTPVLVMDHSAMAEKGRFPAEYVHLKDMKPESYTINKGGTTIKVGRHYYEPETSQRRCLPDLDDLADKMYEILTNDDLRAQMSQEAHECVVENYNWDNLVKEWEYVLDNVKSLDRSTTWDKPHEIQHVDAVVAPENLTNEQFIDWLYLRVLKYNQVDNAGKQDWLAAMEAGQTRDQVLTFFKKIASQHIDFNNYKAQMLVGPTANQKLGELI